MVYSRWLATLPKWVTVASVISVLVVIAARFLPKAVRPWFRAAMLLTCAYVAPKYSFFAAFVWMSSFIVAAALVLTLRNPDEFRE